MQVSWKFHNDIDSLLKDYRTLILSITTFMDQTKKECSKTGLSNLSFLYPEDRYLQRKFLFMRIFSLGTISSILGPEMMMYCKVMFATLVIDPVFETMSDSLKSFSGFALNKMFLSGAQIKILESFTSLKTLYLLRCQWTSTLYLNHLNINTLIMHIDISKKNNGDEPIIVPPLHLKSLELILYTSGPKYQLSYKTLEILLTPCHKIRTL
jgi:hypothetical protein